jgi:hypothetical protein
MKPTLLTVLCLAVSAANAAAQTHQEEGVFVHGGAFATYQVHSHEDADSSIALISIGTSGSSTVPGGIAGVGIFLRPFLSVRADALFEGETDEPYPLAYIAGGGLTDLPAVTRLATQTSRARTFAVQTLLAYHLASANRFRLAVLGGVSFNRLRTRFSTEVFIPALPVLPGVTPARPTQRIDYSFVSYNSDVVVGLDGELAIGEHLALVPQFRVVGGSGMIRLQPGVSLRWHP